MPDQSTQLDRFKEAVRQLGTDDDEARFDERVRTLVRQKPKTTSGTEMSSLTAGSV